MLLKIAFVLFLLIPNIFSLSRATGVDGYDTFFKSANQSSRGNAVTADHGSINLLQYNPAGTFSEKMWEFKISYANFFPGQTYSGDIILDNHNFQTAGKIKIPYFGDLGVSYSGIFKLWKKIKMGEYRYTEVILNYSKGFKKGITFGFNWRYYNEDSFKDYNIGWDLGLILNGRIFNSVLKNLSFGTSILNIDLDDPFQKRINLYRNSALIKSGIQYRLKININHIFVFNSDYEYDSRKYYFKGQSQALFGIEYNLFKFFNFRMGYRTKESLGGFTFGLGFNIKNFSKIDQLFGIESGIGPVNQIDFTFSDNKRP